MQKLVHRGKRFRVHYDNCETNLLELLYDNNMKFTDLSHIANTSAQTIMMLAYGEMSPVYLVGQDAGQIRDCVIRICDYFNKNIADIFPRYFCNIIDKLTDNSDDLIYGSWITPLGDINYVENKLFWEDILKKAKEVYARNNRKHTERNWSMFIQYTLNDATFAELAQLHVVTCENVRQIVMKVHRSIRYVIQRELPHWSINDFMRYLH